MRKRLKNLYSEELVGADYVQELVELGVLIGSHRTALGINQEEFAKMIGVSRRTMTKIENGRQSLSFVVFLRIAAVLEMRPEYLLQELARVTQRKWSRKGED
ncbi:helix-turn-helix transcriptional regulator [uncultured Phascolarctobacterium sp.]|uniref:helix-turn-helix transcriptional regulator n=1 Tax=uncultured Phascolarctobacterium sp. TaxID=512296 RepID=UPI0025ECE133|nr:helix-turn-helix transcriptional regulator [uncultured Phascolarctobacterium sp.]